MKMSAKEPKVITLRGKAISVILPIKEYQALLNRLEDAEDAGYLKKVRRRPLSFRPLKGYLAERRKSRV